MVVLRLFEVQGSDFVLLPEFHTSEQVASLQADGQLAFEESLLQSNVGGVERKKFHRPLVATTVKVDIGRDHIIARKAQDLAQNTVERGSVMSHLSAQIFTFEERLVKAYRQRGRPNVKVLLHVDEEIEVLDIIKVLVGGDNDVVVATILKV